MSIPVMIGAHPKKKKKKKHNLALLASGRCVLRAKPATVIKQTADLVGAHSFGFCCALGDAAFVFLVFMFV